MKSLIFDKEYPEMTASEIKREIKLQGWLLRLMKTFKNHSRYKKERRIELKEQRESLAEDYINGLISDEEYKRKKSHIGQFGFYVQVWQDREDFCDRMVKLLEGEIAVLNDMLVNHEDYKPPKKRKPRRKSWYGYNPRVNASKNNRLKKEREEK